MQQLFVLNSEFLARHEPGPSLTRIAGGAGRRLRPDRVPSPPPLRRSDGGRDADRSRLPSEPAPETVSPDAAKLSPWERYAQVLLAE